MSRAMNAKNCATYLRSIGVEVTEEAQAVWVAREKEARFARRAHSAELARTCGHFRTHDTIVRDHTGSTVDTYCSDCRRLLGSRPLPYRPQPPRVA